jgi:hypothetical protein
VLRYTTYECSLSYAAILTRRAKVRVAVTSSTSEFPEYVLESLHAAEQTYGATIENDRTFVGGP